MENYFEKLQALHTEMRDAHAKLSKLQSVFDRRLSDCYHDLERKNDFSVEEGNYIARRMKETLDKRRCVKDELARLGPVYNTLSAEMKRIEELYSRASRKSYELRQSLNVTMDIEEVYASIGE